MTFICYNLINKYTKHTFDRFEDRLSVLVSTSSFVPPHLFCDFMCCNLLQLLMLCNFVFSLLLATSCFVQLHLFCNCVVTLSFLYFLYLFQLLVLCNLIFSVTLCVATLSFLYFLYLLQLLMLCNVVFSLLLATYCFVERYLFFNFLCCNFVFYVLFALLV